MYHFVEDVGPVPMLDWNHLQVLVLVSNLFCSFCFAFRLVKYHYHCLKYSIAIVAENQEEFFVSCLPFLF